jgi:hypothetical protein
LGIFIDKLRKTPWLEGVELKGFYCVWGLSEPRDSFSCAPGLPEPVEGAGGKGKTNNIFL